MRFRTILGIIFSIFIVLTNSCTIEDSNSTVVDIEGNVYHTIKIGSQTWMVENLRTTKYNDGSQIPSASNLNDWNWGYSPKYCWYYNDSTIESDYGVFYNWYVVQTGKLAPIGWHVPSDEEWFELENFLIANGYNYDDSHTDIGIAKSLSSKTGWPLSSTTKGSISNDVTKNNKSGFNAKPGGCIDKYPFDSFVTKIGYGSYCCIWTSTAWDNYGLSWARTLDTGSTNLGKFRFSKNSGLKVRCIKDE